MNTRNCPKCNKLLTYSREKDCRQASRRQSLCKDCGAKKSGSTRIKLNCGLTRNCPECNKLLTYTSVSNCHKAIKQGKTCFSCIRKQIQQGSNNSFFGKKHTEESKQKAIIARQKHAHVWKTPEFKVKMSSVVRKVLEEGRGMIGRSTYQVWVEKYGREEADKRNDDLKKKRSENAKGEKNNHFGKPSPQGSGNGWSGWYNGWYFRSLHELSYMINCIEKNGLKWRTGETVDLRVEYEGWGGEKRTYNADFLLEEKRLVEIKPQRLHNSPMVQLKSKAAIKFCNEKGYEYKVEDIELLTDGQLLQLYQEGKIIFLPRYEAMFKERHGL